MADLVEAILDVGRLESGRMPLHPEPVALPALVFETFALQAPLAGDKRLRFSSEVPASDPPAWADRALLGRILQNLVGNAVKLTPAGGSIRVTSRLEPSQPPMLRITVSDSGPGVPDALKARLFQKFVTGGRQSDGSGLGLAFCRLAVEAHGGRIWLAETAEDGGATFAFTLPTAAP